MKRRYIYLANGHSGTCRDEYEYWTVAAFSSVKRANEFQRLLTKANGVAAARREKFIRKEDFQAAGKVRSKMDRHPDSALPSTSYRIEKVQIRE